VDAAWEPILERLRTDLATATAEQSPVLIRAAVREMAVAALAPARAAVVEGVRIGMNAAGTQTDRLLRPGGPLRATARDREGITRSITDARGRRIAEDRVLGRTAVGRVRLSRRLHRSIGEAGDAAARIVERSIAAREGVFQAAENFIEETRGKMRTPIPRYIQQLAKEARRAADTGDRSRLLELIDGHRSQMNRLGERGGRDGLTSLRSTVRQFVADVQMRPEDVDRLLARHLEDRAQFQARRIIRNETAEAHRDAYLESTRHQPFVKGYRWTLSRAHPKPDICDCFAQQNLHGLGPGGYPVDEVPETPHPLCLCGREAIVDPHHFRRQLAARRGQPEPPRPWEDDNTQTAHEWLADQPASFRRELLGPTRARIFDESAAGRRRVIDDQGRPIPVGQVLASRQRR
jgi:hypothetical protein